MIDVRIQEAPYDLSKIEQEKLLSTKNTGAIVSFQGFVRAHDTKVKLKALYLEHYPNVTENEIRAIIEEAKSRWDLESCLVVHRVGMLYVQDPIVLVHVMSEHRKSAFEAAEFIMDYLKTRAPFWKKEFFEDGSEHWVEAKISDASAMKKWESCQS